MIQVWSAGKELDPSVHALSHTKETVTNHQIRRRTVKNTRHRQNRKRKQIPRKSDSTSDFHA